MLVALQMDKELISVLDRTRNSESRSSYIRRAVEKSLVADGAMLPRPNNKAAIVPVMNEYLVYYRSASGDLNKEIIAGKSEDDIRRVFDGSEIVSIEAVK